MRQTDEVLEFEMDLVEFEDDILELQVDILVSGTKASEPRKPLP